MFNLKSRSLLVASLLSMFGASLAQAGYTTVTVGGSAYLESCGGTIEVNNGGNDNQLNIVLRGVNQCGTFENENGKTYDVNMGGTTALTLGTAANLDAGYQTMRVSLYSNSRKHADTVAIRFYVSPKYSAAAVELARRGTINGRPVLAYFGGQSESDLQNRMNGICRSVGTNRAISYTAKNAAYDGQVVLEYKNGGWDNRTVKVASQAFVFTTLNCAFN